MQLAATYADIQEVYQADKRPWVLGYSGGKDSTTALQLVWRAIELLSPTVRRKPIYVLSSNTLVESPVIVRYIQENLARINATARAQGLPIEASLVEPLIDESFWVNVMGRGYPTPSNKFRWCTDRLKISPANRFIKDQVARFGEVVLLLGVRKAESSTRSQVMALHSIKDSRLRTHSTLNGAFVFAPIEDWTTNDVWSFLLQNADTPWGADNNDLAAMYRSADGECPLVVDTSTSSCGSSRFGCWVCTVVSRDKSMQAMVDAGQAPWMENLLEIRDLLADTQTPEGKKASRTIRKLDGRILLKDSGEEAALGPYTLDFSKSLLRKILTVQRDLPPEADGFEIISDPELLAIRSIWRGQRHDWEDSLPQIYEDVFGKRFHAVSDGLSAGRGDDASIMATVAAKHGLPPMLLRSLLDAERQSFGMARRIGIYEKLGAILNEDWRTDAEVASDIELLRVIEG